VRHLRGGTIHEETYRRHSSNPIPRLPALAWLPDLKERYPSLWFLC